MVAIGLAASTFSAVQAKDPSDAGAGAERVASFAVGTVVGMPISIVRTQYKDVVDFTKDMVGDSQNPILWAVAVPLCFTSGIVNGLLEGIWNSPKNAWVYSTTPFSAETFSLGDTDK